MVHFDKFFVQKANEFYQSPVPRNLTLINMAKRHFLSFPTVRRVQLAEFFWGAKLPDPPFLSFCRVFCLFVLQISPLNIRVIISYDFFIGFVTV